MELTLLHPDDDQEDHMWRDEVFTMIVGVSSTLGLPITRYSIMLLHNCLLGKFLEEKQTFGISIIMTTGQCEKKQMLRKNMYLGCGRQFNQNPSILSPQHSRTLFCTPQ